MTSAMRHRQLAIGMISELYLPTDTEDGCPAYLVNLYEARYATNEEVAENIVKLTQLGRTKRWQSAIAQWAGMVREAENIKSLRWAFLQGMIYASHASN